jgi:hypothetical protein
MQLVCCGLQIAGPWAVFVCRNLEDCVRVGKNKNYWQLAATGSAISIHLFTCLHIIAPEHCMQFNLKLPDIS